MKTKLFPFLLLALLLINCKGKTQETTTQETASTEFAAIYENLDPQDFANKISEATNAQIVDVRTPEEFNSKHLDKAVNIDYNNQNFDAEIAKLDKTKPVFVYCLSGGRSKAAASKMQEMGFKEIYELNGGMLKWNAAGLSDIQPNSNGGMTLADFEQLTKSDAKVVVDFNATWCGPCQKMSPYLDKMKEEFKDKGIKIVKIDVDQNEQLAADLKIDGIPHIMIFNNGKKVWENVGYISEEDLRKKL